MTDSEIRTLCEEIEKRDAVYPEEVVKLLSLLRSKLEGERWIAVTERLPDEWGPVVLMAVSARGRDEDWYAGPVDIANPLFIAAHTEYVTHWRPLPSSPEVMG